jgi:hypothetical protein
VVRRKLRARHTVTVVDESGNSTALPGVEHVRIGLPIKAPVDFQRVGGCRMRESGAAGGGGGMSGARRLG